MTEGNERLFTFGTLQDPDIQRAVFGTVIEGTKDVLEGYIIDHIEYREQDDNLLSGPRRYLAIEPSENSSEFIPGIVIELTEDQLDRADAYEGPAYARIKVVLASGRMSWVYVKKN